MFFTKTNIWIMTKITSSLNNNRAINKFNNKMAMIKFYDIIIIIKLHPIKYE